MEKKQGSKKIFISYSRREAPFADSLLDTLEDNGYDVWLDYHSLVPGKPWEDQIFSGIREADVILLVVSKESMISPNCKAEWTEANRLKKRIILVIFEATALSSELHGNEWLDFRATFGPNLKKLIQLIENPLQVTEEPPQKGFKAPFVVWISFLVSLLSALVGLGLLLTVYVPFHLLPLPYRIIKRNYNFFYIESILIMLPFIYILMALLAPRDQVNVYIDSLGTGIILAIGLLILLRSAGMRRWGKPIASPMKFANPIALPKEQPKSIRFTVDHAPQDKKYADETIKQLQEQGHVYDEIGDAAEAVFVLVSAFKNGTTHDPEKKVVYPILLQTVGGVDRTLQRIQWIDFRRGIAKLGTVAKLLPEPAKMLKAIGVTPTSNQQTVLPGVVQALVYFLTAAGVFTIGGWLIYFLNNLNEVTSGIFLAIIIETGLLLGLVFASTRSLVNRKGWMVSIPSVVITIVAMGILYLSQIATGFMNMSEEGTNNLAYNSAWFGPLVYMLGLLVIIPIIIVRRKDLLRWFPARK